MRYSHQMFAPPHQLKLHYKGLEPICNWQIDGLYSNPYSNANEEPLKDPFPLWAHESNNHRLPSPDLLTKKLIPHHVQGPEHECMSPGQVRAAISAAGTNPVDAQNHQGASRFAQRILSFQ